MQISLNGIDTRIPAKIDIRLNRREWKDLLRGVDAEINPGEIEVTVGLTPRHLDSTCEQPAS